MWIEAIVMPREEDTPYMPVRSRDRREVHQAGQQQSAHFREAVLRYLESQRLMSAVKWVSEPGCLPMVTLRCQERVLERLRKAPQFEAGRSLSLGLAS